MCSCFASASSGTDGKHGCGCLQTPLRKCLARKGLEFRGNNVIPRRPASGSRHKPVTLGVSLRLFLWEDWARAAVRCTILSLRESTTLVLTPKVLHSQPSSV
ncbi:hypothetical protein VUR80DRAFT_10206 [Thermomyces stellatus]